MNLPATWQRQYWLDLDYLVVARAALKCGAYFTALLYVEQWLEDQYGCLKLDHPPHGDKVGPTQSALSTQVVTLNPNAA